MRKTLICMLAMLMLLSAFLVACGGGDSGSETKPGESTSQPESDKKPGGETKLSEKPSGNSPESSDCVHEAVTDAAVEATCTAPGKTEGSHCAKCGEILLAQEVIPAGHIFVDGKCTRCGMKISMDLRYFLNDDGESYSVSEIGHCKDFDIVIPSTCPYDGKPVTSIKYNAFDGCSRLTSVTIPDSVTSIGSGAFRNCTGLTGITIPDSVTSIGSGAFEGTAYYNDESNWENDVLYIGKYLIKARTSLSGSYSIKEGTVCIADSAFYDCTDLTSVTIPDSVTTIGHGAFIHCIGLTSVTIPDSVTSIGSSAFHDCSGLTSVTIPDSVTSIGSEAFKYTAYYNDESNWENDVLYIGNCLIEAKRSISGSYSIKDGTVCIADMAFEDCSKLASVVIGNSVTNIGAGAFYNCKWLTSVIIGNSVKSIGNSAFQSSGLKSVTIPDSVTSIGDGAFRYCTGLTSVTIPDSVTSIGESTFFGCKGLTSVTIPDSVTNIGYYAFYECTGLTSVTIPDSVTSIGEMAFANCTSLTSVAISDSVTSIGNYAFNSCTGLTSVTIPDSVISIGDAAFKGCKGLTSVTIGNGVTSIGEAAFKDCSKLTSITIGNGVMSIGSNAFYNTAYYNNSLNWDNKVLYIGNYLIKIKNSISGSYSIKNDTVCIADSAFSNCEGLTKVTIPDSIKGIGHDAFYECTGLTSVTYTGTKEQWQAISKDTRWAYYTGNFTVYCTDGEIAKADA